MIPINVRNEKSGSVYIEDINTDPGVHAKRMAERKAIWVLLNNFIVNLMAFIKKDILSNYL